MDTLKDLSFGSIVIQGLLLRHILQPAVLQVVHGVIMMKLFAQKVYYSHLTHQYCKFGNFERILFSRITLKDTFGT